MKIHISILLLLVVTSNANAQRRGSGFRAFPKNNEIKQNSWIMLEAYFGATDIVDELNDHYPAYLEAKGHKVKLRTVSKHEGAIFLNQVLLKPAEELHAGKTYYLKIDSLNRNQQKYLKVWKDNKSEKEAIYWKVVKGKDKKVPKWKEKPRFIKNVCTYMGGASELYTVFNYKIKDESGILIKTELTNLHTKKTRVYYLVPKNNTIKVGNDAFSFGYEQENKKFKVRFSILDASGNKTKKYTSAIEFDHPYEEEIDLPGGF